MNSYLELDHDWVPDQKDLMRWAQAMRNFMLTRNPRDLPTGVKVMEQKNEC